METQKFILSISQNLPLQEVRADTLHRAGYEVTLTDAANALDTFRSRRFDLVLMCHSILESDRVKLAESMHTGNPGIPLLLLYNHFERSAAMVDAALISLGTPAALLSVVDLLFAKADQP